MKYGNGNESIYVKRMWWHYKKTKQMSWKLVNLEDNTKQNEESEERKKSINYNWVSLIYCVLQQYYWKTNLSQRFKWSKNIRQKSINECGMITFDKICRVMGRVTFFVVCGGTIRCTLLSQYLRSKAIPSPRLFV